MANGANKFMLGDACNQAADKLIDEIGSFEGSTGRGYTLLIIPHSGDEEIVASVNGKPAPSDMSPEELLKWTMEKRKK